MRALDRKLLRDLARIWPQILAIALVLACGIMILVMSNGTLLSLQQTRTAYYERHRFADVFAAATRAPKGLVGRIRQIDGVAQAEARIVTAAVLDLPGMTEPASADVISLPRGAQHLNLPLLRRGRMPDPLRPDEVVLSEPFALANGLEPGAGFAATLNGQRRVFQVAGLILSPEFIYTIGPGSIMPDDRHFGQIWMNEAALAAATDLNGAFNNVTLGLSRGASEPAVIAALDRLLAPYGGSGAFGRDRQTSHMFLEGEMHQLATTARALPPVFLIVSAFLVNMVLGRLIALERGQIGLLKALGYARRDIAVHYLKMSLGIGVIGVSLGLLGGWWAGHWMTTTYSDFFRFPWLIYDPGLGAVAVAVLAGFATVVMGALRAVNAATALAPATAMLPPAPPSFRRGWVDGLGRAFGLRQTTMMILRSVTRWPGRAAVTFLGVAASIAVLIACFFTFDGMDALFDELFVQANRQDVTLTLAGARNQAAVTDVLTLPSVRFAEGSFALPVRLVNGTQNRLTSLQARAPGQRLTQVIDNRGRPVVLPPYGLALPERLAETLGVTAGSLISVELLAPPRELWEMRVSAILRQSLGEGAYISADALFAAMRQPPQVNQLNLLIDPLALPQLHRQIKQTPAIAGMMLWSDVKAQVDATINQTMRIITVVFSSLGMLIAIGVVYNAARIQQAERAHELASLRVLGFSRAEVGYVLVGEMMLLTVLAIIPGMVLGYGFAIMVHSGFASDLVSMPFAISRRTFGISVGLVFFSALGAALWVRRRLDRIDLIAALKQKE